MATRQEGNKATRIVVAICTLFIHHPAFAIQHSASQPSSADSRTKDSDVSVSEDPPLPTTVPEDATEETLIQRIKRLRALPRERPKEIRSPAIRMAFRQELLAHIEALLARFPDTAFRDEAQIIRLEALAELARSHPGYLTELLEQTKAIAASDPDGALTSENAYYAMQAFVYAARLEGMPDERRLFGTAERYLAFLADYPDSPRVPVIRASLIRNLIALERIEQARAEFARLRREFPDHPATRRAQGELYRVVAVGQPFAFQHTTPDGKTIRTTDYFGKVLVIHFWATWSQASVEALPLLVALHEEFGERGLQLIGVNVDQDRAAMQRVLDLLPMPWPQYYDEKGLENKLLIEHGVLQVPTYFVVDRKAVLRAIDSPDLREAVEKLLEEK